MVGDPHGGSKGWEALDGEIGKPAENRGQVVAHGEFQSTTPIKPRKMPRRTLLMAISSRISLPQSGHVSNFCGLRHGPLEPVQLLSDQMRLKEPRIRKAPELLIKSLARMNGTANTSSQDLLPRPYLRTRRNGRRNASSKCCLRLMSPSACQSSSVGESESRRR